MQEERNSEEPGTNTHTDTDTPNSQRHVDDFIWPALVIVADISKPVFFPV